MSCNVENEAGVSGLVSRIQDGGFTCSMSSAKTEDTIRHCSVLIACVTSQFFTSAERKQEISFAVAQRKPIIPVTLEKLTWPPSGDMSLIFAHLSPIDCSDDVIKSQWPADSKQVREVLQQVRTHAPGAGKANFITTAVSELVGGDVTSPSSKQNVSDEQALESFVEKLIQRDVDDVTGASEDERRLRSAAKKVAENKSSACAVL